MHIYGGLPPVAAAGVLLLFSLYLGLYHAFFAAMFLGCRRFLSLRAALVGAPFFWVAVEFARARVTGFPWDLLGNTQIDNLWLLRLAPLTGVLGLSLVVAAVNALWLLTFGAKQKGLWQNNWGPLAAGLSVLLVSAGSFVGQTAKEKPKQFAVLVQDNLSVGVERGPVSESKNTLLDSLSYWSLHPVTAEIGALATSSVGPGPLAVRPELIAWAEAPTDIFSTDPAFRSAAGTVARRLHAPVIADTASIEAPKNPADPALEFASAAFFNEQGNYAGRYDKMHLVPFGEYVPFKPLFAFTGHLLDGLPFSPGRERRTFDAGRHRFGTFICYESVFGGEVREFARQGAQVFVNLSDDGWYGDSSAPWEHLDMVRMRAVENHRWVLRATNTGVTGTIDPEGRLVASLPRHVRGALLAPFAYMEGTTFYTRHGDWLGWLCVGVSVGMLGSGALLREKLLRKRAFLQR